MMTNNKFENMRLANDKINHKIVFMNKHIIRLEQGQGDMKKEIYQYIEEVLGKSINEVYIKSTLFYVNSILYLTYL